MYGESVSHGETEVYSFHCRSRSTFLHSVCASGITHLFKNSGRVHTYTAKKSFLHVSVLYTPGSFKVKKLFFGYFFKTVHKGEDLHPHLSCNCKVGFVSFIVGSFGQGVNTLYSRDFFKWSWTMDVCCNFLQPGMYGWRRNILCFCDSLWVSISDCSICSSLLSFIG